MGAGPRRVRRVLALKLKADAMRGTQHWSTPAEAVEVEGYHLSAACGVEAEHGCLRGWGAIGVLIDQ